MNPASRIWDIPPPPGTEDIELENLDNPAKESEPEPDKEKSEEKEIVPTEEDEKTVERPIDRINPYLKNPEYIEYEKRHLERRRRSRSRSHSRERHRRRRYSRSRSRSRDRYRRSRSRSRRRRRRYSSSRSRSRSPSHFRRRRFVKRRSRSSSRYSRSRSRSRQHVRSSKNHKDKKSPPSRKSSSGEREKPPVDADISEVDMKIEEEEDDQTKDNVFKNDGTFLEMFKKMQEQQQVQVQENPAPEPVKKPFPAFGKRRGGKVLKTGMVQKIKQQTEEETTSQDAWSVYMKEVRKYKEACCDDDSKTRPLVK